MFRISLLADYAVVVLADMARTSYALLSVALIAEQTNISEPTVAKVLKMLLAGGACGFGARRGRRITQAFAACA